jgi:hypothetical protein
MPRGESGRIIIGTKPVLKRRLYGILTIQNLTLKEWFEMQAGLYIASHEQNDEKAKRAQ